MKQVKLMLQNDAGVWYEAETFDMDTYKDHLWELGEDIVHIVELELKEEDRFDEGGI